MYLTIIMTLIFIQLVQNDYINSIEFDYILNKKFAKTIGEIHKYTEKKWKKMIWNVLMLNYLQFRLR
jgi:hypothetical protein